jgi:hypothetical protein
MLNWFRAKQVPGNHAVSFLAALAITMTGSVFIVSVIFFGNRLLPPLITLSASGIAVRYLHSRSEYPYINIHSVSILSGCYPNFPYKVLSVDFHNGSQEGWAINPAVDIPRMVQYLQEHQVQVIAEDA